MQEALRSSVRAEPLGPVRLVAGADVSYNRYSPRLYVGLVVLTFPSLELVEQVGLSATAAFPYVPGLLSFRELPPLLEAWQRLTVVPDLLVCDGHGYAHPRRCGLACHAGVTLDVPTVGCAKSLLIGVADPLGEARGSVAAVRDGDEVVGLALRTRERARPLYLSIGHRCALADLAALGLALAPRYRLPETTRAAHAYVNALRRADSGQARGDASC